MKPAGDTGMRTGLRHLKRSSIKSLSLHAALAIGSALFLIPLLWMISTSLKIEKQTQMIDSWAQVFLPNPIRWKNYPDALEYVNLISCFKNSIHVTILTIIGTIVSCTLVAYSFARLRWPGRNALFMILISTMMLPSQVTMVPVFLIYAKIGWVNTLRPLWFGSFFGTAFFIFLLRQFFMTIPKEIEEAARIDGCGYLRTLLQILIPLIKPALLSVIIFQFMWTWNDFLGPLIYVQSRNLMTLTLGLQAFTYAHAGQWHYLMAASFMMTLPVIIVFFCLQRYFIQGVTLTGIKG